MTRLLTSRLHRAKGRWRATPPRAQREPASGLNGVSERQSSGSGEERFCGILFAPSREARNMRWSSAIRRRRDSVVGVWASLARAATCRHLPACYSAAFLYLGRAHPAAGTFRRGVIALTLAPLVKAASRHGISPWITALFIVALSAGRLGLAADGDGRPGQRVDRPRARKSGRSIKEKLAVLDQPLAAARQLQTALFGSSGRRPTSPARTWCCRWSPSSRRPPASFCCFSARCCSSWPVSSNCARASSRCSPTARPSCASSRS